jgi:hypothetical protein
VSGDRREEFIALLRPAEPWPGAPRPEVIADALLPVVDLMIRQAQAEQFEAGYQQGRRDEWAMNQRIARRDRAATLRGETPVT